MNYELLSSLGISGAKVIAIGELALMGVFLVTVEGCGGCGPRAKTERAATLISEALSPETRARAATALACPPTLQVRALNDALSDSQVATCEPVGRIAAFHESILGEEGVWQSHVNCRTGYRVDFLLRPVHAQNCGAENGGFYLSMLTVVDKEPHIVFEVLPTVRRRIDSRR